MKIKTLEKLARESIGDGKAPNLFFVSTEKEGVITVSRSFKIAYGHWRGIAAACPSLCPILEDRLSGTIASVNRDEGNGGRLYQVDDSRPYWKPHVENLNV